MWGLKKTVPMFQLIGVRVVYISAAAEIFIKCIYDFKFILRVYFNGSYGTSWPLKKVILDFQKFMIESSF